jgi:hypothetical protein
MSKQRTFTPEFKARVVLEELTGVKDKSLYIGIGACPLFRSAV